MKKRERVSQSWPILLSIRPGKLKIEDKAKIA